MATRTTGELITITHIEKAYAHIRIVGDSPLIMHAWAAKAKRQILEKEIGATKTKAREVKNPIEEFVSSMYWLTPMPEEFTRDAVSTVLETARFGFPVTAFKQAAIAASYRQGWTKDMASLRGAFFIEPNENGYYSGDLEIDFKEKKVAVIPNVYKSEAMVEIVSDPPLMREDMVRVGMGAADIRYRGEFRNWSAEFNVSFNRNGQYSMDQIINIINAGGFICGVGEWRPDKDGIYGQYHVEA